MGEFVWTVRHDLLLQRDIAHIDRADPRVPILDMYLMRMWRDKLPYASIVLDIEHEGHPFEESGCGPCSPCFRNAIVTLRGDNKTVIYRVVSFMHDDLWEMAWPD